MRKLIILLALTCFMCSCGVQQFAVNTETLPFQNGGTVFGEKTRGKVVAAKYEFFVLGINIFNADTKQMAESIKATSYTIESKSNIVTGLIHYVTFGVFNAARVKVIKRDK